MQHTSDSLVNGRSLGSACLGFAAYGAWGVCANMDHGLEMAWRAGLTQGSFSFFITLILTAAMEYLFRSLRSYSARAQLIATGAPTCLTVYLSAWLINHWAGTPNIFLTILPGAILSTLYTLAYLGYLQRVSQN